MRFIFIKNFVVRLRLWDLIFDYYKKEDPTFFYGTDLDIFL